MRGGIGIAMAAAIAIVLLGFISMGMLGMAVFHVGDMPFGGRMPPVSGDRVLEFGMWTNILWPLSIPMAHLLSRHVHSRLSPIPGRSPRPWARIGVSLLIYILVMGIWAIAVATLLHGLLPAAGASAAEVPVRSAA